MKLHDLLNKELPLVMGIINCTPDSFFEKSRKSVLDSALHTARVMVQEGADILDIGGESSRPGSSYVSEEVEMERVIPLIEAIRKEMDVPISIDTRKKAVAQLAIEKGAQIINDISALRDDKEMASFAALNNIPVILMHMKGNPENMQDDPFYENVKKNVFRELEKFAQNAEAAGIKRSNIIIDPGIGFGKRLEDNIDLLKNIDQFKKLGYPLLIGLSRKRFIGSITGKETNDRLAGTIAANAVAMMNGAHILRVHDVGETVDMIKILRALR